MQVSGNLTKMIAVFAEDWLDIGDRELSGVRSIDAHDQDFESCSGDEGSLGFDPPVEFIGGFGYSRDHRGVEFGAMNISVMDLQDPQDKSPHGKSSPHQGFSGDPANTTPAVRWDTADTEAARRIQE